MKKTVTDQPIHRRSLFTLLGFPSQKIPANLAFTRDGVECVDLYGRTLGVFDIVVTKSIKAGKPRVFIKNGNKLTPFGRASQAHTQIPTRSAIASTEALFVSLINNNAEKIKSLAAFKSMSKEQMLNLKSEYLAIFSK